MHHYYSPQWFEFFEALLYEIVAMWRTTRQMDAVKLVAVDLDDTLWRGIAAEGTLGILEGWPMGFMESLVLLKKRGILLAIVSRNDEHFIQSNWNQIVQGQISLDDFVIRKINFGSKAQNLAEIIAAVNLLPRNVVMIDDNPAERAAIREQLPDVRVLGSHPYYLKRILLWAPETQRSVTSQESACKADLVRAQLQREDVRKTMSHEQFLQTLELAVSISIIRNANDVFLHRALELLNKTNQFNMTGARYTFEQCHQLLATGHQLHILHAEDRFTQYGLIGAAWVSHNCVEQFVVSCRALGLGVEDAFLANLSRELAVAKWTVVLGKLVPTDTNMACREVYRQTVSRSSEGMQGFGPVLFLAPFEAPRHVAITTTFAQKLPAPLERREPQINSIVSKFAVSSLPSNSFGKPTRALHNRPDGFLNRPGVNFPGLVALCLSNGHHGIHVHRVSGFVARRFSWRPHRPRWGRRGGAVAHAGYGRRHSLRGGGFPCLCDRHFVGSGRGLRSRGFSNIRIGMFLEIATTFGALLGAYLATRLHTSTIGIIFGHRAFVFRILLRTRTETNRQQSFSRSFGALA